MTSEGRFHSFGEWRYTGMGNSGRVSSDRYPHVRQPKDDGRCAYCGQREGVCPGLTVTTPARVRPPKNADSPGQQP